MNKFSLRKRIKSTTHAWRGFGVFIKRTHNAWLQIFFALCALYMGYLFSISTTEWLFIIFAIGLVITTEILNTAIEIDIDLTSPDLHPFARDTKDVAAAGVLFSVLIAGVIGLIIFLPKILLLIK